MLIRAGRPVYVNNQGDVFTRVETRFVGLKQRINALTPNCSSHEKEHELPATVRPQDRTFRSEHFGVDAVGDYLHTVAFNATPHEYITHETGGYPQFIDVPSDLVDPDAWNRAVFPRQGDRQLSSRRTAEVGGPLVPDRQVEVLRVTEKSRPEHVTVRNLLRHKRGHRRRFKACVQLRRPDEARANFTIDPAEA